MRTVAPGATIVRPADVFGPDDRLLNLLAKLHRKLGRVPLVDGGRARVQPLYVRDLAQAIFKIAVSEDPAVMLGQTYELAGPEEYTYAELAAYVFEAIRDPNPLVINLAPSVADALGAAIGKLPNPLITRDRFARMATDVVLDDLSPTLRLHDLGLQATRLDTPGGWAFLAAYRQGQGGLVGSTPGA